MKKLFISLSAIFVIFISCNSNSGEKYTLKPNMKAGESYTMEYKMEFDQEAMGTKNEMLMSIGYLMKIKNVTAQQDIDMDFMYNKMVVEMKSKMFSASYNSDSTYNEDEGEDDMGSSSMRKMYANTMGRMINKPIQITLDKDGQVKQVTGYRELVKAIRDSANADSGTDNEAVTDMMGEKQIKQVFQQTFGTFPNKPVAIGEEWTSDINVTQSSMIMKYKNTYKITEILKKENEALIDVKGTISMGVDPDKKSVKMDAKGTLSGNMIVDLATGLVKSGKQKVEIKMEIEMMDKKVPMTMNGFITLRGKKQ